MKIGFIGLGNMGSAMAYNLIKAGHEITVYNRTRSKAEVLRFQGAKIADTPTDAALNKDAIVHMLANDAAVEEIVFGTGNLLNALPVNAIHISMSTISVELSKRLNEAHQKLGKAYIAALVLGRPESAATAKLFVLAGGPLETIKRCQPLFDAISQKLFHVSEDPPTANAVKLATNFLFASVIESLSEAFALVEKFGIDPEKYLEILTSSVFDTPVYKTYGSLVSKKTSGPVGFKMELGAKDLKLVLAAAEEKKVPMPVADVIHDHMLAAIAQGFGNEDWSAVSRIVRENARIG